LWKRAIKYIEWFSTGDKPMARSRIAGLIAACGESNTNLLLLHAEALPPTFSNSKPGVGKAG
jgi:hypothetical protein